MKLIFEKSQAGRRGIGVPKPDLPVPEVPADLRRAEPPRLPELSEPEVLRHFTELSTRNFGIDTGFYPLGRDYAGFDDALLVAVTEKRTTAEIDCLAEALAA